MLAESFGEKVEVKLDLFHGIQRLTRTIKKATFESSRVKMDFHRDLKALFRSKDDFSSYKRTKPTPDPVSILKALDNMTNTYKCILPSTTQDAISLLRGHAANGCLR